MQTNELLLHRVHDQMTALAQHRAAKNGRWRQKQETKNGWKLTPPVQIKQPNCIIQFAFESMSYV